MHAHYPPVSDPQLMSAYEILCSQSGIKLMNSKPTMNQEKV